jgi:hypothetical protein
MARKKTPDYRDFKTKEIRDADGRRLTRQKEEARPEEWEGFWWKAPEDTLHSAVWAAVSAVDTQQQLRRAANMTHAMLYGDRDVIRTKSKRGRNVSEEDRVTYNICRQAADTLCAKISKAKPKCTFVTEGGDWSMQRKAKRLDKFVLGILYRAKAHAKARDAFRDCTIYDTGFLKFYRDGNSICVDKVHPDELLVDDVDGQHGEPRCLYQAKAVHKEVLKSLYPKSAHAIEEAASPSGATSWGWGSDSSTEMVEVREAWHLPSGDGVGDGRHVIAISGATLFEEKWDRCEFPFVPLRFSKRLRGYYGAGVVEQLVMRQRALNRKLRTLNECLRLMARPVILTAFGSEVNMDAVTNEVGVEIRYKGIKPDFFTPPAVPPELLRSIEDDIRQGLESVGISKLDAAAQKPAGLDSQPSLREFNDIASERFVLVGQMYEEAWPEFARQAIALAKEAAQEGHPLQAQVEGRRGLEFIKWEDVDLDADAFILKALPTSSLPTTPAARQQTVQEWLQAGWIDGLEARRLMDMPDLESSNNAAFAGQEDIEWLLEDLLDGKPYEPPEPFMDLAYGLKRFQSTYLRARRQGAPEGVLDNLRTWMLQAQEMLQPPAPPPGTAPALPPGPDAGAAPPALPAGPEMPPGPPMAPPLAA